jgi:C-terminal processing protease CtpA/Prc
MVRCKAWVKLAQAQDVLPAVVVTDVPAGSVAERAGLRPGDRVIRMQAAGEQRFDIYPDSSEALRTTWEQFLSTCDGSVRQATLTIRRAGAEVTVSYPRDALDVSLFTLKAGQD